MPVTDLDTALAAATEGAGQDITVRLSGQEWTFPPGFPLDILSPLLPVVTELSELLGPVMARGDAAANDDDFNSQIVAKLAAGVPQRLADALAESGRRLFDGPAVQPPETSQWARWQATRPTLAHWRVLLTHLSKTWGVGLGEASRYFRPSQPGGATSNGISPPTPAGPPSTSGAGPVTPAG